MMHTKGPWVVDEYGDITANGEDVAHVVGAYGFAENDANARLIAAAPRLLAALQAAVSCGMVPQTSARDGGAAAHVRQLHVADEIRDAINEATGNA
jgi:hypothetical protein